MLYKVKETFANFYNEVVVHATSIFCTVYLFAILIIIIGITSDMTFTTDHAPYQYKDYPFFYLLAIPLVIYAIKKVADKVHIHVDYKIALIVMMTIQFIIIGIYAGGLYADPAYCLYAARGILGEERSRFYSVNYIAAYPYQSAYIIFLSLFYKFFGYFDFLIYKLCCVLMYGWTLYFIGQVFRFFLKEEYTGIIDLALVLFLPGWLIIEFGYNDIPGLFFTVLGFYCLIKSDGKYGAGLLAAILTGIGLSLRSNYLILFLAFTFASIPKENKKSIFLFFIETLIIYKLINNGAYAYVNYIFPEIKKNEWDYPVTRWLYIGMQQSTTGAGYWALDTAVDSGSGQLLAERMKEFAKKPTELLRFMTLKMANTYSMPDFEGFDSFRYKNTLFINGLAAKSFLYLRGTLYDAIYKLLDIFHVILIVGNLSWLFTEKKKDPGKMFGFIYFIGVALFYTAWEIKARYIVFGILFLIPTGILGIKKLVEKEYNKKEIMTIVLITIVIIFLSFIARDVIVNDPDNIEKVSNVNNLMKEYYGKSKWD